jgi:hypothetical protein
MNRSLCKPNFADGRVHEATSKSDRKRKAEGSSNFAIKWLAFIETGD